MKNLSRRSRRRSVCGVSNCVEPLENRRLLTVTVINGKSGTDYFELASLKASDQIIYNGNGGSDHISIKTTTNVETVLGQVTLKNINGGTFSIDVNDLLVQNHALKVGGGKITGAVAGVVDYSGTKVTAFSIGLGSSAASTAQITDLPAGSSSQISLPGKYDVTIGSANKLDAIKGDLVLSTYHTYGATLTIDDSASTANKTITYNGQTFSGIAPGKITTGDFTLTKVIVGTGDKTATFGGLTAPMTYTSIDGNDKVNVLGAVGYIPASLKLVSVFGKTALKIDDSSSSVAANMTVSATHVKFGKADVAYSAGNTLTVLNGAGADKVTVTGTNASPFTLKTGAGKDFVNILAATGPATVDGGGDFDIVTNEDGNIGNLSLFKNGLNVIGTEQITFSDRSQTAGHQYAITPNAVKRDGVQLVTFAPTKTLSVYGGEGSDTIDGYAYTGAGLLAMSGGGGDDKLYGHKGSDDMSGDEGNDTMIGYGGVDDLFAGNGNDLLDVAGCDKITTADGEFGTDTVRYDNGISPVRCEHLVNTVIVSGNVFTDTNGNGVRDGAEKGRAGVQVWLDHNFNNSFDFGDIAVFTDASGNYVLHDVDYGPNINMHVLAPFGYHQTNNGGQPIKFGAGPGATKSGVNFGVHSNP